MWRDATPIAEMVRRHDIAGKHGPWHTVSMILSATNLSCRRGGRLIFRHISFRVHSGTALVITGDNGAGKSSLIAMIAGLLAPETGRLEIQHEEDSQLNEMIGLMGHRDGLKPSLTVSENLKYARGLLGASMRSIDDALSAVGLSHAGAMPVEHLSAGQRRRISVARLLSCNRPIWLMDEPGGALDLRSLAALTVIMNEHLSSGGMILAATHQPLELQHASALHLTNSARPGEDDEAFWEDEDFADEKLFGFGTNETRS